MFKRMQELSKLTYRFMQLQSEFQWDFLKYIWKSYIDESSQGLFIKKKKLNTVKFYQSVKCIHNAARIMKTV